MKFLDKYNFYKQQYDMIVEGTIRSIIPWIEKRKMWKDYKEIDYNNLSEEQKKNLQDEMTKSSISFETWISGLTDNKQYQSWIYNMLQKMYESTYNIEISSKTSFEKSNLSEKLVFEKYPIHELSKKIFEQYSKICKSPKCEQSDKNILKFEDVKQFINFVRFFTNTHPNFKSISNHKFYSNDKYDIYQITMEHKRNFQEIYGLYGFKCGWCVINPEKNMFEHYLDISPCYYLWTYKNSMKPFALLEYGSKQFKDIHNNSMNDFDSSIIDGLIHCSKNMDDYKSGDLLNYKTYILQESGSSLGQYCCQYIFKGHTTYDFETNTIDCHGDVINFNDDCFDQNGTFDFKVINFKSCWRMFDYCEKLVTLPDSFTIPEGVINCECMFAGCKNLVKLPNNFKLPNSVSNVNSMFFDCESLINIPESFELSENVYDCSQMFMACKNLQDPISIKLNNNISSYGEMFIGCNKLSNQFKQNFYIPDRTIDVFN